MGAGKVRQVTPIICSSPLIQKIEDWRAVADYIPGKNYMQVMEKSPTLGKAKPTEWTKHED